MRYTKALVVVFFLLAGLLPAVGSGPEAPAVLTFVRDGVEVKRVDRDAIVHACSVATITIADPYYETKKTFRACPLRDVLVLGFGEVPAAQSDVFLRARDGYVRPTTGERLAEDGAYLAFADAEHDTWAPIGRNGVDPGPFYLVWAKPEQRDRERYPWPYQLVQIELIELGKKYPHVLPIAAEPDGAAWQGFGLFRERCLACHSINGEGGKVGPDLNVPQSIVEYRPTAQVKAYIRDPSTFRYGNMPPHRDLTDAQLDTLIAYFEHMKTQKHDPQAP